MGQATKPPGVAVNPTCSACGGAVYCGGPTCPSSSLPVGYDGTDQLNTQYLSVATVAVNGPSAGFFVRGMGR